MTRKKPDQTEMEAFEQRMTDLMVKHQKENGNGGGPSKRFASWFNIIWPVLLVAVGLSWFLLRSGYQVGQTTVTEKEVEEAVSEESVERKDQDSRILNAHANDIGTLKKDNEKIRVEVDKKVNLGFKGLENAVKDLKEPIKQLSKDVRNMKGDINAIKVDQAEMKGEQKSINRQLRRNR